MLVFATIAILGLAALLLSVIVDLGVDAILPDVALPGGGDLSSTSLAAFFAAFGGTGLILNAQASLPLTLLAATLAGLVIALAVSALAKTLMSSSTDATPAAGDLVGRQASVITPIPPGGLGEILVHLGGHQRKLSARSEVPVPLGGVVRITAELSATSVRVSPEPPEPAWGGPGG